MSALFAEKKLVELGHKAAWDEVDAQWPGEISLGAACRAVQQDKDALPSLPWALPHSEAYDAAWLDQHGFHVKKRVERTWTETDVEKLEEGLVRLPRGDDLAPSERTNPLYYLSHHVMEKRFSAQACARQIMSMHGRSHGDDAFQLPEGMADEVVAQAATLGVADDSDTDESEDEAIL